MTENDRLQALLQQALPPIEDPPPGRDLWPAIVDRRPPAPTWTWLDLGAAAVIVALLALYPGCLWLLLYHL